MAIRSPTMQWCSNRILLTIGMSVAKLLRRKLSLSVRLILLQSIRSLGTILHIRRKKMALLLLLRAGSSLSLRFLVPRCSIKSMIPSIWNRLRMFCKRKWSRDIGSPLMRTCPTPPILSLCLSQSERTRLDRGIRAGRATPSVDGIQRMPPRLVTDKSPAASSTSTRR